MGHLKCNYCHSEFNDQKTIEWALVNKEKFQRKFLERDRDKHGIVECPVNGCFGELFAMGNLVTQE